MHGVSECETEMDEQDQCRLQQKFKDLSPRAEDNDDRSATCGNRLYSLELGEKFSGGNGSDNYP